jgi:hypothetical protein
VMLSKPAPSTMVQTVLLQFLRIGSTVKSDRGLADICTLFC